MTPHALTVLGETVGWVWADNQRGLNLTDDVLLLLFPFSFFTTPFIQYDIIVLIS